MTNFEYFCNGDDAEQDYIDQQWEARMNAYSAQLDYEAAMLAAYDQAVDEGTQAAYEQAIYEQAQEEYANEVYTGDD